MKSQHLNLYQCPRCRHELALAAARADEDGEILSTEAHCPSCQASYPVRDGILYLLPDALSSIKQREINGWNQITAAHTDPNETELFKGVPFQLNEGLLANKAFGHWREAQQAFPVVLTLMGELAGRNVLDVGASVGWAARHFARRGANAVAADMCDTFLLKANHLARGGDYFERVCTDAERLPFPGDTFDYVFCCATLHHSEHPGQLLSEIHRILRRSGNFFAISEAYMPLFSGEDRKLRTKEGVREHLKLGINEQVFTQGQYANFFRKAGLQFKTIHLRWDVITDGETIRTGRNIGIRSKAYHISDTGGSRIRRLLDRPLLLNAIRSSTIALELMRQASLHLTAAYRILIGEK